MFVCSLCCIFSLLFAISVYGSKDSLPENVDFDLVNTNGDDQISYDEFEKWHSSLPNSGVRSKSLFTNYDKNSDGGLSVMEFVPLALALAIDRKPEVAADALFKKLDINLDGELTKSELEHPSGNISSKIAYGLLQVADADFDGKITSKEFFMVAHSFNGSYFSKEAKAMNEGISADSLIATLDADKDMQISKKELFAFANQFNQITQEETDSIIKQLDKNNDAKLSTSELKQVPQLLQRAIGIRPIEPTSLPQ